MPDTFENKLWKWITSKALLKDIDQVLLAVSGGADSVAMVHAMVGLKKRGEVQCNFVIGHVNHCLRAAHSDADEAFVKNLALSLGVPAATAHVDVRAYAADHKLSIETAGRTVRLKTLAGIAQEYRCDCIATAHHKDDQAETIIHRLMRGTGFRGLCGIRPASRVYGANFIRPMLAFGRDEIIQYCRDYSIQWREDASNRNIRFTRNKIRHHLLPALNSNDLVERLVALSSKSQRFLQQTKKQAETILNNGKFNQTEKQFCVDQDFLRNCSPWVLYETVRQVLVQLNVGLRNYKQDHFTVIGEMVKQQSAKADFPGQVEILIENNTACFRVVTDTFTPLSEPLILEVGKSFHFGPWEISAAVLDADEVDVQPFFSSKDSYIERFDLESIRGDLEVRLRRKGDRFWPIGAKSSKKVGRFLIDSRLDGEIKQTAIVIADAEKVIWVAPIRMSKEAKLTPLSRKILEIKVRQIRS